MERGIRVNAVSPIAHTRLTELLGPGADAGGRLPQHMGPVVSFVPCGCGKYG